MGGRAGEVSGDFASDGEGPGAIGQSWAYEGFGGLCGVREGAESEDALKVSVRCAQKTTDGYRFTT